MLHNESWTLSLGRYLNKAAMTIMQWLKIDMTQSKWGHRVMDQIFREGKFALEREERESGN